MALDAPIDSIPMPDIGMAEAEAEPLSARQKQRKIETRDRIGLTKTC